MCVSISPRILSQEEISLKGLSRTSWTLAFQAALRFRSCARRWCSALWGPRLSALKAVPATAVGPLAQLNVPDCRISPWSPSLFSSAYAPCFSFSLQMDFSSSPLHSSVCPSLACHLDWALGSPQHCSGGLCLFHHSRLKTNNNRKCKKRKYLLVWHGLH